MHGLFYCDVHVHVCYDAVFAFECVCAWPHAGGTGVIVACSTMERCFPTNVKIKPIPLGSSNLFKRFRELMLILHYRIIEWSKRRLFKTDQHNEKDVAYKNITTERRECPLLAF